MLNHTQPQPQYLHPFCLASCSGGLPEEVSTATKLTGEVVVAIEKGVGSKFRTLAASTEMVEALQTSWKGLLSTEESVSSGDLIDFCKAAQEEINRLPISKGMESVTASILILKELYSASENLFQKLREKSLKSQKSLAVRHLQQRQLSEPEIIPICASPVNGNTDTDPEAFDYAGSGRFPASCPATNPNDVSDTVFLTSPGILYSLQVTEDTDVTLSTCNTADYDTQITVYDSDNKCVAANDDDLSGCSLTSVLTFSAIKGRSYLVLVHGFFGFSTGAFLLTVTLDSGSITCKPKKTKLWCQHVGYLDYATLGKGFQKATQACLKLAVIGADEIPEKAGAQNASPLPFTWLMPAVLSITASMVLVKSLRGLSSWTAMPMVESEESEVLDLPRNQM